MLSQVVIGTVCDSPQLAPSEREQKFQIGRRLAVEAQLFRRMVARAHLIRLDAKCLQPVDAVLFPVSKPLKVSTWFAEEFKLHLLKLSGTESKVTRCDLVTEGLTDLSDTKWNFLSGSSLYILEVYKNTLSSLWTKVYSILSILGYTLECLEHQVELTDICKVVSTTAWAADMLVFDVLLHLFLGPAVYRTFDLNAMLIVIIFDQLVSAETFFTLLTVHQRIGETAQMSAGYPCLGVH